MKRLVQLHVHCASRISITTNNELNSTEQYNQSPEFKSRLALYNCLEILIRCSCCSVHLHLQVVFYSVSLVIEQMFQLFYLL